MGGRAGGGARGGARGEAGGEAGGTGGELTLVVVQEGVLVGEAEGGADFVHLLALEEHLSALAGEGTGAAWSAGIRVQGVGVRGQGKGGYRVQGAG